MPVLSLLFLVPLAGAVAIALLPKERAHFAKQTALCTALLTTFWALLCACRLDLGEAGLQLEERWIWMSSLGITYHLALDGISLPILFLTAIIAPVSVAASFGDVPRREREYYCSLLVLIAAGFGAVVAIDTVLFTLFLTIGIVPSTLLIGIWGGKARTQAATKQALFSVAAAFLFLVAMIGHQAATGAPSFSIPDLEAAADATNTPMPAWCLGTLVLAILFLGGWFPAHTWVADSVAEAPRAVSIWTIGTSLPLALYAAVRFAMPFQPSDCAIATALLAGLAITTLIYCAGLALVQPNLKRRLAYAATSHAGLVALGVFSLRESSVTGALFAMFAGGLALGGLAYLTAALQSRRNAIEIERFGGIASVTPWLNAALIVVIAAVVAAPGLAGFPGHFLVFVGAFDALGWWTLAPLFGVIVFAAGLAVMYHGVMLGPLKKRNAKLTDLEARDLAIIAPLVVIIVVFGIFPDLLMRRVQQSAESAVARVVAPAAPVDPPAGGGKR